MAGLACGDFVKQDVKTKLRNPDAAVFVTDPSALPVTKAPDGSYSALLSVRADDGLDGATVLTFFCKISKDAEGHWQLQSLNQLAG